MNHKIYGMKRFFSFPNPVNDAAARTVALGVLTMAVVALATNTAWLLIPLTYGFVARVAAGPTISPLGQFAVRVAAPRLTKWQKSVPGPPKRFAQALGLAFSGAATIVWLSVTFLTKPEPDDTLDAFYLRVRPGGPLRSGRSSGTTATRC